MKLNPQIITDIIERTDIVDVISDYVSVNRSGSNYKALCPFHDDNHPSMMISPAKQIYKCFVCGAGGNSVNFVKEFLGVSFSEAAKIIADKFGIAFEITTSKKAEDAESKASNILKATDFAAEFFHKALLSNEGKGAYNYFIARGIDKETIEKFKLGYSPNSWDALFKELKRLNFTDAQVIESKLITEKNDKKFDMFRNRAMFPIRDFLGRAIAFGGRKMDDDDADSPKYMNSPDSIIYNKSRVLYGFFESKREILTSKAAILVEGYADLIALHKFGFTNVIAPCGTALTDEQAGIIKRNAEKVFLVYDGDTAGIKATLRSLDITLAAGLDTKIVSLPEDTDPDDFVRSRGDKAFKKLLDNAENFIDYIVRINKDKISEPAGKAEIARKLIEMTLKIPDKFVHDEYIQISAAKLRLTYRQIEQLYKEITESEHNRRNKPNRDESPTRANAEKLQPRNIEYKKVMINESPHLIPKDAAENMSSAELNLLNVILMSDNALAMIEQKYDIHHSYFPSVYAQNVFSIIYEAADHTKHVLDAISSGDTDLYYKDLIMAIAIPMDEIKADWQKYENELDAINWDKVVRDSINFFIRKKMNEQMKDISAQLTQTTDENKIRELMNRLPEISQRLQKKDLYDYKDILLEEDESGL
jgi:DNA primase